MISGTLQFNATSPDLTLNGGYTRSSTKMALNWEFTLFKITLASAQAQIEKKNVTLGGVGGGSYVGLEVQS